MYPTRIVYRSLLLEQINSKEDIRRCAPVKAKHSFDRHEELTQRDRIQKPSELHGISPMSEGTLFVDRPSWYVLIPCINTPQNLAEVIPYGCSS